MTKDINIIKIDSADSTNNWLALHEEAIPSPSLVYAREQTSGRGQRGNHWESEPGKNITASLIFHPKDFAANLQFRISEAVALAIIEFLRDLGVEAKVKWPNDIYIGNKKICGILVEHVVTGRDISRTIAGFGININQKQFLSDAPNPVSLYQITGLEYDIDSLVESLTGHLKLKLESIFEDSLLHDLFLDHLWRRDGKFHRFKDSKKGSFIEAKIQNVTPEGFLILETADGVTSSYAFKEVEFDITPDCQGDKKPTA